MVIDVVVRMAEAELETLSAKYDALGEELYLARQWNNKKTTKECKEARDLVWARYDQLSTFITNVKYEYERVGA